jgi:hypothetical protein
MAATEPDDVVEVLTRVSAWPTEKRLSLAQMLLQTLRRDFTATPRPEIVAGPTRLAQDRRVAAFRCSVRGHTGRRTGAKSSCQPRSKRVLWVPCSCAIASGVGCPSAGRRLSAAFQKYDGTTQGPEGCGYRPVQRITKPRNDDSTKPNTKTTGRNTPLQGPGLILPLLTSGFRDSLFSCCRSFVFS